MSKQLGHLVKPDPKQHVVIFEWWGEGDTPEQQAKNAWDNMRNCDTAPIVTVLHPDGTTDEVDLDKVADADPDDDKSVIAERLEYLRGELRAERISWGELAELQSLAPHIAPDDTELQEAIGHDPEIEPDA